ncbi:MAG: hypothetical protein KBA31_20240 [Alphaproteobacteria bacterium]|nr:hypothetical protein [Alphaproteobacteria bacterium]
MIRNIFVACAAFSLSGSALMAADEPAKPSSCAMVRSIDSWTQIDETHAYIHTSPRRKFKITFVAPCRELKWAIFARVDTRLSAGMCLSAGDALVFGRGTSFADDRFEFEERCTIRAVEAVPFEQKEPIPAKPAETPPAP